MDIFAMTNDELKKIRVRECYNRFIEEHPEKREEYNKTYREKHGIKLRTKQRSKVFCDTCSKLVSYSNLSTHKKTKQHLLNSTDFLDA